MESKVHGVLERAERVRHCWMGGSRYAEVSGVMDYCIPLCINSQLGF